MATKSVWYAVITNGESVGIFSFDAANEIGKSHRQAGNKVVVRRSTQAELVAYEQEWYAEMRMLHRVYGDEHINF